MGCSLSSNRKQHNKVCLPIKRVKVTPKTSSKYSYKLHELSSPTKPKKIIKIPFKTQISKRSKIPIQKRKNSRIAIENFKNSNIVKEEKKFSMEKKNLKISIDKNQKKGKIAKDNSKISKIPIEEKNQEFEFSSQISSSTSSQNSSKINIDYSNQSINYHINWKKKVEKMKEKTIIENSSKKALKKSEIVLMSSSIRTKSVLKLDDNVVSELEDSLRFKNTDFLESNLGHFDDDIEQISDFFGSKTSLNDSQENLKDLSPFLLVGGDPENFEFESLKSFGSVEKLVKMDSF